MSYQTVRLFGTPLSFAVVGFIFCGTVCSYNFHWYLTPPHVAGPTEKVIWNIRNKQIHLALFFLGLVGSAIFSLLLIKYWFWLLLTAFVTFLYSAPKVPHPLFAFLKNIAVGKTIFLAFAWTHVTAILPLVLDHVQLSDAEITFVVNRFFFIYAICICFDYRDREDDQAAGIRSLITFLNDKGIKALFIGSILVFIACTLLLLTYYIALINVVILLIPGLITLGLYQYARTHYSDLFYYLVLDGLMALSSIIMLVAGI